MNILSLIIGGSLGAIGRYYLNIIVGLTFGVQFPYHTLITNILGSFLIGIFWVMFEENILSEVAKNLVIIGFLGSLTTFSTFSYETLKLFNEGNYLMSCMNVLLNNVLCLLVVFISFKFTKFLLLN